MTSTEFIKSLMESNKPINVFLTNGIKLSGIICYQDKESITLLNNSLIKTVQLVYKTAIATIVKSGD